MGQNSAFPINFYDPNACDVVMGSVILKPLRSRNGIFEYSGSQNQGNYFSSHPSVRITASVRPGTAANFISKVARVKRRVTLKLAFPIDVPGESGTVVDYINADIVISMPVEATEAQVRYVLASVEGLAFDAPDMPLRDLLVNGNEPY